MKPSKDFSTRLDIARRWRLGVEPFIKEIFMFCAPGREMDFEDRTTTPTQTQIYHSLGEEVATDLAGDLVTYFTPPESRWASYAVVSEVDEQDAQVVTEIVSKRESDLFHLISQSNYNDVAPQWGFEAATHGTAALWVVEGAAGQALHCEVVPPHELLIAPGHMGHLDRFREIRVPTETITALLQSDLFPVDLSDPSLAERIKKPGLMSTVIWGFWLNWSDPYRPMWMMEIVVDGKRVTPAEPYTIGDLAGSCPLLVGRFNPQPGRPWGRGSGWKALPDLRVLDKIDETVLGGLDQALLNTLIYANDGHLDMSDGLEAGKAYPAGARFDNRSVWMMPKDTNLDYGFYSEQAFEQRIRTAFYQDGPRQTGQTPPTATQWIDERRRVQQRIGKPSAPLWTELVKPLIQRVEYIGVTSGRIPEAISHNSRDILVTPISPLQNAHNNDQVMTTRANLDMAFSISGEQVASFVDPVATFTNVVRKTGDQLFVLRKQEAAPDAPPAPPQ